MNDNTSSANNSAVDSKRQALITLVHLALPAIIQQMLGSLLQYVDTAMVGHLGAASTAAVSTSTSVNWLVHSLPNGFAIGLLALLSQAYGRGDKDGMKRLSALGCRLVIVLGIMITAICLGVSPFLPGWMQADVSIRKDASAYFFIVSVPLFFFVSNSIFASCMHAVKDTRTPMIVNLSANVLNVLLNWLFIYKLSLGIYGAAYATAVSTAAGGAGMFIAYRRKSELRISLREALERDRDLLEKVLRVALPVTGTTIVSCLGYIAFSGMVNGMGVTIFAAHAIAVTAEEIFYLPGYGIRTATSALIGIAIGERDQRKFLDIRQVSLLLTVALMMVSGAVLFFVAHPLMSFFTNDETVIRMGTVALKQVAFIEPFFGLMVAWEGISYGTGRTRTVFIVEACSMWGVRILCTWLVIRAGYGLRAVWYCMMADNVVKAVALTICGLARPVDVNTARAV
ncbi:MAG: MATE family efflux transporter [Flexilinea sp.]|nr:MATE family efflux transporter [Flexilinea sp.]